jgi:acyl-CoA thioester hydrolase
VAHPRKAAVRKVVFRGLKLAPGARVVSTGTLDTEARVSDFEGLEVWRGGVNTWECDDNGHLNVRFYVARAAEGLVGLASAMGMKGAFRAGADATLLIKEQHIRFLREARPGAALHMLVGVVSIDGAEARVLQRLIHSRTGELAATFQTVITHVTSREGRAFPWSARALALARGLLTAIPERAGARSVSLAPVRCAASLAEADRMDLVRLGAGAFGAADVDSFGRMRPELFIGRVSDGVPRLREVLGDQGEPPAHVGGAVVEYRLVHLDWPRAGDRFEIRSGLAGIVGNAQRIVHWMLDPVSGRAWGSAEAIAVRLDLQARRMIPLDDAAREAAAAAIVPGLGL